MRSTPESIKENVQISRLREALPRWIERVPLYHRIGYADALLPPGLDPAEALGKMPFITKSDLRQKFPDNFLGLNSNLDSLVEQNLVEVEHTSGTSEERTALLLGRGWWAEQELAALNLNPLVAKILKENPSARRVTINSPVCNNDISYVSTPTHDERIVGDALFVSLSRHPFLLSEEELAVMAAETVEWKPVFLDVDPVYAVVLALFCERNRIRLPTLRFIFTSYEYTSVMHRQILERVFQVPVLNLYGATETGHLLMETENGRMVPSRETAFLEVVGRDERGIGAVVATTLTNEYMPLIRYRVGDLAEKHDEPGGANYILHGREKDAFHLADGTRSTTRDIDQCFEGVGGMAHYQLFQSPNNIWQLRYVPENRGPTEVELASLRGWLQAQLKISDGLTFEPVDLLLPEGSGKFRLGYPYRP